MSKGLTWQFNGKTFKVGESINEYPWEDNNIFPVVWFKGKLYNAFIKPETTPRIDRVCLIDLYYPEKKPYWTTANKVFNIIELCKNN